MGTSRSKYAAFKQKPRYVSRPWDRIRHAHFQPACRFLRELEDYRRELVAAKGLKPFSHTWLLPLRDDFRRMRTEDAVAGIQEFVRYADRELRHIGIWLLSRHASRFQLLGIDQYCFDRSGAVRKYVVKALRRLEVWNLLVEMPEAYANDAWIEYFAPETDPPRPFRDRLKQFARNLDNSHAGEVATPSRMPFWSLHESWQPTPPKSVMFIRRMLRRIQHWVRWGVS